MKLVSSTEIKKPTKYCIIDRLKQAEAARQVIEENRTQQEDKRDAETWMKVARTATSGLNVKIVQVTGDEMALDSIDLRPL